MGMEKLATKSFFSFFKLGKEIFLGIVSMCSYSVILYRCAIDTSEPDHETESYDSRPSSRQDPRMARGRRDPPREELSSRGSGRSGYSGSSGQYYDSYSDNADYVSEEAIDYYGELFIYASLHWIIFSFHFLYSR